MLKTRSLAAAAAVLALSAAGAAQAKIHVFGAPLAPEGVVTTGTGYASVTIDDVAWTMRVKADFYNLTGNTTAAHIHCCTATAGVGTAGVASQTPSFSGFPLGVKTGSYDTTFDLNLSSSWNAAFVTASGGTLAGAQARLLDNLGQGKAYLNIHTSTFGGGEIRAELVAVPEPSTWAMMIGGFGLVGWGLRRAGVRAARAA